MSNQLATVGNIPALSMDEAELVQVLSTSLYPGASMPSIKMVIAYCRASQLDPMQKPVHIVPMWDKNTKQMRDVVMPGIGLYRTQAARSGEYGGITEPEFGEDVTENVGGVQLTYPKWARVTVRRILPGGQVVEFSAREFWKENYATAAKDSDAPNAMWKKRPYGQLAKCAEAQALRKAFPEFGAQPTADEMEGKAIEGEERDITPTQSMRPALEAYPADSFEMNLPKWRELVTSGRKGPSDIIAMLSSKAVLTDEQTKTIRDLAIVDAELAAETEGTA